MCYQNKKKVKFMLKTPQKKCQTQKKLTKSRKKSPDSCIYHFFLYFCMHNVNCISVGVNQTALEK